MRTRKITVIAASVGVAVAAATGVTYASSALGSAPESASVTRDAAPVPPPRGGNGTGTNAGSNAASDAGGDSWRQSKGGEGRGGNGGENRGDQRGEGRHHGHIQINERTYSADPGSCITVINAPASVTGGAASFSIRNDSHKTVEFFNGAVCDGGGPIAEIGPHSSNHNVKPSSRPEGMTKRSNSKDAAPPPEKVLLGSFRVID